ncbi:MAG: hypothetical protein GY778_23535 [bacterium]|nr:hypothetical protein [bacterium]
MDGNLLGFVRLSTVLVGLGILVGGFVLMLLIARIEKRSVGLFIPLEDGDESDAPAYAAAMNQAAQRLGYQFCSTRKHAKGGTYRVFGALWLAPSQAILALVSWGKIGGMKWQKTCLYSRADESRYLASTDDFGEVVPSDAIETETLLNADLFELNALHEERIDDLAEGVYALSPEDAWGDFAEMNAIEAHRLNETGMAAFVDAEQSSWRFTMKGSLCLALGYVAGLRRANKQRKRMGLRRPGQAGYQEWQHQQASFGTPAPSSAIPDDAPTIESMPPIGSPSAGTVPEHPPAQQVASAWPAAPPEQSRYGIVSFVLALIAAALLGYTIWHGGAESSEAEIDRIGEHFGRGVTVAIMGFVSAIIGLVQRHRRKIFAVLGLVLNGMILLLVAGLIILGLAMG